MAQAAVYPKSAGGLHLLAIITVAYVGLAAEICKRSVAILSKRKRSSYDAI